MSSEAIDTITLTLEETGFSKDAEVEEEHTENIGPSLVDMPNEVNSYFNHNLIYYRLKVSEFLNIISDFFQNMQLLRFRIG